MRILQRFYFGAGLFCLWLLIACCARGVLRQPVWGLFEALGDCDREEQHSRELDAQLQNAWQRMEYKSALIAELVAGRRSLWEAVRALKARGTITPQWPRDHDALYPSASADEALGCHIIYATMRTLEGNPAQAAVIARLKAELARSPAKGTVRPARGVG